MLKSEAVTVTGCLQPWYFIDKNDWVVNEMFLAEFGEEYLGQRLIPRRREPHMQQAVGCGIDGYVQPVAVVIDLAHCPVDRDVIRLCAIQRL